MTRVNDNEMKKFWQSGKGKQRAPTEKKAVDFEWMKKSNGKWNKCKSIEQFFFSSFVLFFWFPWIEADVECHRREGRSGNSWILLTLLQHLHNSSIKNIAMDARR